MAERELLFSVTTKASEYKIFSNGEIEGFGEGAIVANYFDLLVARASRRREHRQPQDSQSPEVGRSTA